jgi:hypothetical protein
MLNNFLPKNRAHDEIMWGNMVEPYSPQLTILYSIVKMQEYKHRLIICYMYIAYLIIIIKIACLVCFPNFLWVALGIIL